ncbi:type 1 glutamine amidotransferase [Balneolales bacterium ANBcel1]|nr:type 1 glutamine amidotransferase [Balneolales bacterium ANBcel1]
MQILKQTGPFLVLMAIIVLTVGCEPHTTETAEITETGELRGKNVAFLVGEGFHDGETLFPMAYLINHGANVTVIGAETGEFTAYNSDVTVLVPLSVDDVVPGNFDALVIPGGGSPDNLRQHDNVVSFVRDFYEMNRPMAAICHGPQVLITAGVVGGRTLTGFQGIEDEITGAGASFEDVEVMVDGNLITSRLPQDLPAFSRQIAEALMN